MPKKSERGCAAVKRGKLERAIVMLTAIFLALMAGWWLGTRHSRQILRQSNAAAHPTLPAGLQPVPASADPEIDYPLDINTASAKELASLPGIGEAKARDIVEWRRAHGRFLSETDLLKVPGIGEGTLERLLDYITVGG